MSHTLRLLQIQRVLAKYGLDEFLAHVPAMKPLRWLFQISPSRFVHRELKTLSRGERIRLALIELGPVFIKLGQILSTRRDLLPEDVAQELALLQDRVPPFPSEHAKQIIEDSLELPIEEIFVQIDDEPMASASIAQVYGAVLKNGDHVVIKVLRPGIDKVIKADLSVMYLLADLAHRYWSEGPRLRPKEVVAEYEKTIFDELDLVREAANAGQLRRNFEGSKSLYVPKVYWDYARQRVLVLERIDGIPMGDMDALRRHGVNFQRLGERGVEVFFTQVFRDNFFHADMHPGNIFISRENPDDPQYISVDFGIVGTLSKEDQQYLAENLLAFFDRDYNQVAQLHVNSGWVPRDTRVEELEFAIRTVCEPIFQKPLNEISFGQVLVRLFQTARRFDMEVQPQLVLLEKTLLNIEGLGRQLYPQLDLWATAKPFLEKWMADQLGPKATLRKLKQQAPHWGTTLPEIPGLAHQLLQQATAGQLKIHTQSSEIDALRRELRQAHRRNVLAIVGGALVIAAALIFGLDGYQPTLLSGAPVATWLLGGLGGLLVLGALFKSE